MTNYGVDPYGRPAQQRAQAANPYKQPSPVNQPVSQPQQPQDVQNGAQGPSYPSSQNTGISGTGQNPVSEAQQASQAAPVNGNYQEYVLGQLRGQSGMTNELALRNLAPTFKQHGINTQIASDGTARGRIFLPNGEMVTLIGDGQTWGNGDWAWRTGQEQFGSGGGGTAAPGFQSTPQLPRTVLPTTPLPTYTPYQFGDRTGILDGQTALLKSILANPHSMTDQGVEQLKQRSIEGSMSMQDQLAQQLAQRYASQGTAGGGRHASEQGRLGTALAGDVLNSNREIDIARMQQNRADELNAVGAGGSYLQQQLAHQMAQAGENQMGFGSQADAVRFALESALAQGNLDLGYQGQVNQNDQFYSAQALSKLLAMAGLNFQYQNAALTSNNANNPWSTLG
jgi:hypothetical protein